MPDSIRMLSSEDTHTKVTDHGYRSHATKYSPYSFLCESVLKKPRYFRVFRMIKIDQTHAFLNNYVYIHQIGSHFVGGYRLDFSPTEQESKTSILQAFSTR